MGFAPALGLTQLDATEFRGTLGGGGREAAPVQVPTPVAECQYAEAGERVPVGGGGGCARVEYFRWVVAAAAAAAAAGVVAAAAAAAAGAVVAGVVVLGSQRGL